MCGGGLNPREQIARLIQLTLQSPTPLTVAPRLCRPVQLQRNLAGLQGPGH